MVDISSLNRDDLRKKFGTWLVLLASSPFESLTLLNASSLISLNLSSSNPNLTQLIEIIDLC